ncbi:uncharacterized protein LOC134200509 [Bombyx mori]|uniref:uncharacterized protein LOC134200509 n=1 Tax=Bombyx mori TaxID=7091 RepID=UPI000B3CDBE9
MGAGGRVARYRLYRWRNELRALGVARVLKSELRAQKAHSWRSVFELWSRRLANPMWDLWTVAAVYPVFDDWVNRGGRRLAFRLVQVLTEHGCFEKYLHRKGAELTTRCHRCGHDLDGRSIRFLSVPLGRCSAVSWSQG